MSSLKSTLLHAIIMASAFSGSAGFHDRGNTPDFSRGDPDTRRAMFSQQPLKLSKKAKAKLKR